MAKNPIVQLHHYEWLCKTISPVVWEVDPNFWGPGPEDWESIIYLANLNLVLPTLYQALCNKNQISDIPLDVSEALSGFNELNQLKNQELRCQMIEVTQVLNHSGIKPVWLKGATLLLQPNWCDSDRTMLDLDFWLPNFTDHSIALKILEEDGYYIHPELIKSSDTEHHHFIRRIKNYLPAGIEIHRNLVSHDAILLMNQSQASCRIIWQDWESLEIGILSPLDRCMQSYIQCTEMNLDGLCLGQVSLMKTLDFIRRYQALCEEDKKIFHGSLQTDAWCNSATSFFTYLNHFWGFGISQSINNTLIKRVAASYQPTLLLNKRVMMLENYSRIFFTQLRENGFLGLTQLLIKVPKAICKTILG